MFESVAASKDHALGQQIDERFTRWYNSKIMQEVVDETSVVQVHYC